MEPAWTSIIRNHDCLYVRSVFDGTRTKFMFFFIVINIIGCYDQSLCYDQILWVIWSVMIKFYGCFGGVMIKLYGCYGVLWSNSMGVMGCYDQILWVLFRVMIKFSRCHGVLWSNSIGVLGVLWSNYIGVMGYYDQILWVLWGVMIKFYGCHD